MRKLSKTGLGRVFKDWAPALPFTLAAGGLLALSAVWLVRSSFAGIEGGWSLQAWRDILGSELALKAIKTSFGISIWVATICTVIGSVLAWLVANMAWRRRSATQAVLNVVSNFGGASLAIAMVATLGAVGFFRLLLSDWLGFALPLDLYSPTGLVVTYLYFILPLFVLLVLPAMAAVRPEWWEA
ncbi:MAG: ABC transporter permease, partial [Actinobacteria bacterium]|nr:ABC transporter permease [Actinomycetota bacterium]